MCHALCLGHGSLSFLCLVRLLCHVLFEAQTTIWTSLIKLNQRCAKAHTTITTITRTALPGAISHFFVGHWSVFRSVKLDGAAGPHSVIQAHELSTRINQLQLSHSSFPCSPFTSRQGRLDAQTCSLMHCCLRPDSAGRICTSCIETLCSIELYPPFTH